MQRRSKLDELAHFKAEAMAFLAGLVPSSGIVFYTVDSRLNAINHAFHRIHSGENESYAAFYHALDPFHPRQFASSGKSIVTQRDLRGHYHGGEYYQRFMAPLGLRYEAEMYLFRNGQVTGGISLHRTAELGDFNSAELEMLGNARPFLEHTFMAERPYDSTLLADEWGLTERERSVLRLVCSGAPNAEVGRTLFISVPTVKTHLQHIFDKSGLHTRAQLIAQLSVPK